MSKILIIEDDEEIALLERDYLEANGYQVEVKPDGSNAAESVLNGDRRRTGDHLLAAVHGMGLSEIP